MGDRLRGASRFRTPHGLIERRGGRRRERGSSGHRRSDRSRGRSGAGRRRQRRRSERLRHRRCGQARDRRGAIGHRRSSAGRLPGAVRHRRARRDVQCHGRRHCTGASAGIHHQRACDLVVPPLEPPRSVEERSEVSDDDAGGEPEDDVAQQRLAEPEGCTVVLAHEAESLSAHADRTVAGLHERVKHEPADEDQRHHGGSDADDAQHPLRTGHDRENHEQDRQDDADSGRDRGIDDVGHRSS